jgi:uncharacterized protein (UPF0332 family)
MNDRESPYLTKAWESLRGAESEFGNGRYDNAANRSYYACFQAAIAALLRAGIRPRGDQWSHAFVPAQFDGQLINRRKLYATELRTVLARTYALRQKADYDDIAVRRAEADRSVRQARAFVEAIGAEGDHR